MLKYFQIWIKPDRQQRFKDIAKATGRTQVEVFERMTEHYLESDEYKDLVRLNSKRKKRNTMIALILVIGLATLSSPWAQQRVLPLASQCNPMEPTCLR